MNSIFSLGAPAAQILPQQHHRQCGNAARRPAIRRPHSNFQTTNSQVAERLCANATLSAGILFRSFRYSEGQAEQCVIAREPAEPSSHKCMPFRVFTQPPDKSDIIYFTDGTNPSDLSTTFISVLPLLKRSRFSRNCFAISSS